MKYLPLKMTPFASFVFSIAVLMTGLSNVFGQLVIINHGLVVPIGRSAKLTQSSLEFYPMGPDEECRVQVEVNEPYYSRVGKIEPQVFDCKHFLESNVRYIHSGNPLLDTDVIKFFVYKLNATDTVTEQFHFRVDITIEDYMVVFPMDMLVVSEFFGQTNTLNSSVVEFLYDDWKNISCHVSINTMRDGFPKYGELSRGEGEEKQQVRVLQADCDEFLTMGIRYEHLAPPTPNIDYIVLNIEVTDPNIQEEPMHEKYFVPIDLTACYPNQPPEAALMSSELLHVDQFILTTLRPSVISASDEESVSEDLVFHIVDPPGPNEGMIVHLDDHTKRIESFTQGDLVRLNIAYSPPAVSFAERQVFVIGLLVYDAYFQESQQIRVMLAVRPSYTNAPRVSINKGLTLLEGQSRAIKNTNFRIVDDDNLFIVRAKIVGGMRHGQLLVDNRRALMFSQADVDRGAVVYHHDDSDTDRDSLELRITDGRNTIRTTFPINVLPKDDSFPYLINNVELELNEGQSIRITRFMLVATDKDSSDNFILYRIIKPPSAGEILKRYSEETYGYPITEFTQRDLLRGQIYYQHLGQEIFQDSFDFILLDNHSPPNESPTQVMTMKITQVHDLPPEPYPGSSLTLTVRETDVSFITKDMLRFTDLESDDDTLLYTITTPPYFDETHSLTDAGRLFSAAGLAMLMKDPSSPTIRSFSQSDINSRTIAYMAPFKEGGPLPRQVKFVFSVSDVFGNVVLGQFFDITILPVNNQEPMIYSSDFVVQEGSTLTFTPTSLSITDMDTLSEDLVVTLTSPPTHGLIQLYGRNLTEGDSFTMDDIMAGAVSYMHGGSDRPQDEFSISATDGRFTVSQIIPMTIMPLNDELPSLIAGLNSELETSEGGSVTIDSQVLSATDPDTNDLLLQYIVVQHPLRGVILKNGVIVNRFNQMDVNNGLINYRHTAGEIGLTPVEDLMTFLVSDKSIPTDADLPVHDVTVTILPVDNQPPGIVFGNPFFVDEGSKTEFTPDVISVLDRDSTSDQLVFNITEQPSWGFVENIQPDAGSEKSNAGKPVSSFTFKDLQRGHINYVQSVHEGVEPTSDSLVLSVTDGERYSPSVTFLININPRNDEKPTMRVQNLTVYENSFFKLRSSFITVNDLDIPMEMLMFSVMNAPRYGILTDRSNKGEELPVYDFNLNEFMNTMKLSYIHDGSESTEDRFDIRVSDGKHTLRQTVFVTIIPVNDESPEIIKNVGITLSIHESRLLSPVVLLARDKDTPDELLYVGISSLPQRGVLQKKIDENTWVDILEKNFTITQEDLNLNLIRYTHRGDLGTKGIDRFKFSVSDGQFHTPKETFRIVIEDTKRQSLEIVNNGLQVLEGEFIIVTTQHLSVSDNSDLLDSFTFTVMTPPTEGQIEYIGKSGFPITSFTELDLIGQRVIYRHLRTDRVENDAFTFSITNGYETRNDTFHILVIPVDNSLPALLVKEPLTSSQNGIETITQSHLLTVDQDTSSDSISYIITQHPTYGRLLLGGVPIIRSFSQLDIDNFDVSYRHEVGRPEHDDFYFVITDGTNDGFTVNSHTQYYPIKFPINIDVRDDRKPTIRTLRIPPKLQAVNQKNGFILSQLVLLSEDECGPSGVLYVVTHGPLFGHLENPQTSQRIAGQFTQEEVNQRQVMYVIREEARVTNDSFQFEVYDCAGNVVIDNRFEFHWAIIQFHKPKLMICETAGTLPIEIERIGYQDISSFVTILCKDQTADEGTDYIHPRANQIQFDPLNPRATWDIEIIQDDLEENRERFKVSLQSPFNALLGEFQHLTVVIKNAYDGVCRGEKVPDVGPPDDAPDLTGNGFVPPTQPVSPNTNFFNPLYPPVNDQGGPQTGPRSGYLYPVGRGPSSSNPLYVPDGGYPDPVGGVYDGCCGSLLNGGLPVDPNTFVNDQQYGFNPFSPRPELPPNWFNNFGNAGPPRSESPVVTSPSDLSNQQSSLDESSRDIGLDFLPQDSGDPHLNVHSIAPGGRSDSGQRGQDQAGTNSRRQENEGTFMNMFAPSVVRGRQHAPIVAGSSGSSSSSSSDGDALARIPLQPLPDLRGFPPFQEVPTVHDASPSSETLPSPQDPPYANWFDPNLPCSGTNEGEIRTDRLTGEVYLCDGIDWLPWDILPNDQPVFESRCDEEWIFHRGRCYLMSNSRRTWDKAQRRCRERYNSHLASILSSDDQAFIRSIMAGNAIWIGFNDKTREGQWEWVSGDSVSFSRWKPSAMSRKRPMKNCAVMNQRFRWMDETCDGAINHFVCMKPAIWR